METIFINTVDSKTNEPHKFVFHLPQRLDLKILDKYVALENLCICYTCKNIRQQYRNNKLEIIAPTWNYEFELPDDSYSVSDIQNYIDYITEKHETLTDNPPIRIYINRINNRLVFKIKVR